MDKLWAPWRIEYIRSPKEDGCIFCIKSQETNDRNNLVLYRGKKAFVLMNLYPYSNGHLMISPYQHTSETDDLSSACNSEIMDMANKSMSILSRTFNAEGYNFGANFGKTGGASNVEHLHYHIVPRWTGDTNFMPVTGGTSVIVEGLQESWDLLKPKFNEINEIA